MFYNFLKLNTKYSFTKTNFNIRNIGICIFPSYWFIRLRIIAGISWQNNLSHEERSGRSRRNRWTERLHMFYNQPHFDILSLTNSSTVEFYLNIIALSPFRAQKISDKVKTSLFSILSQISWFFDCYFFCLW